MLIINAPCYPLCRASWRGWCARSGPPTTASHHVQRELQFPDPLHPQRTGHVLREDRLLRRGWARAAALQIRVVSPKSVEWKFIYIYIFLGLPVHSFAGVWITVLAPRGLLCIMPKICALTYDFCAKETDLLNWADREHRSNKEQTSSIRCLGFPVFVCCSEYSAMGHPKTLERPVPHRRSAH